MRSSGTGSPWQKKQRVIRNPEQRDSDRTFNGWRHFLYADEGLHESTQATQIYRLFDILMDLFYRVGMCTNVGQLVIMVCQPCCTIWYHSTDVYRLSMMVEGLTYRDRLYHQVFYPECNADLTLGCLDTHWHVQNGVGLGDLTPPLPPPV